MNFRTIRAISAAAVALALTTACSMGSLPGDFIKPCMQEVLKVQTEECAGFVGCPSASTRVSIDSGVSPAVARMAVGSQGWLVAQAVGNNMPTGCLATVIGGALTDTGLVQWVTSDANVVALVPRPTFFHTTFVKAVAPGEAIVYAQVRGTGRVDFALCPNHLDSCVPVGKIVVTP